MALFSFKWSREHKVGFCEGLSVIPYLIISRRLNGPVGVEQLLILRLA